MARATSAAKNATATSVNTDDLFAGFSDEEKAELLALTGQNANLKGEKVPVIKVNYCDLEDRDGNSIKKGNFVYNQNSKEVSAEGDGTIRVEYIGIDLGKAPKITVLAYRQQYAYYSDDPKQRCSSQIFGQGEIPVGSTLKYECRSGKCPRRAEGIDKKEKCACQYVVMCQVRIGDEIKPAMMYVKGKSFISFGDYLKGVGSFPLFFAPTRLTNKMEKQGSVTYYVSSFELLKESPFPQLEARENMKTAKDAVKALDDFKKSQMQKTAVAQIVDKSAGSGAKPVSMDVLFREDDDIVFDD
ncbi:hypothetical protein [Geobacter sp. SVR]|uniref:hypothetical protein n=1 Tax=Geobacter sp. SVR TaxID=2495594 RepID=UPI00143EF71B|nr:hypothetical protein [Geobacter sp. SVR]BCS54089.1 hypothetical protein GSVR_23970 [Geobacter sp. SVR]GCF87572.1 hypothetical protein GSbR_41720 [Geobacter sp. SVR]